MHPVRLSAAAVALLLFAACGETPTESVDTPIVMAADAAPPPSSGPIVTRYQGSTYFWVVDPQTNVGAFFGGDPVAGCSGDPTWLDDLSFMDVDIPDEIDRFAEKVKGQDVRASVWDPAPAFNCPAFLAAAPMATGTVDFTSTDNDFATYTNTDNKNHNAFGVQAHGAVLTPGGDAFQLTAHSRCVWDGHDLATTRCSDKVNVH